MGGQVDSYRRTRRPAERHFSERSSKKTNTNEFDSAIERYIFNAVLGDHLVLRDKWHDWAGGLNAKRINELAAKAGIAAHPVFEWKTADGETVLSVYRPDSGKRGQRGFAVFASILQRVRFDARRTHADQDGEDG